MANPNLKTFCFDNICMNNPVAGSEFRYANKDTAIPTAGFGTYTQGAYVTLDDGIWVVTASWVFQPSSTTGTRNLGLHITGLSQGEMYHKELRIATAAANAVQVFNTVAILPVVGEETFTVEAASSVAIPTSGRTNINAMRLV